MADGALRSLLVDGILGGVGGVLAFLPQILILFFFIAVLEDCGYMARAAYLMDRLMVARGPERPIVHSHALVVRLRRSRHHGRAGDRERSRPPDHDPGRAAVDLLGAAAGLCLLIAAFIPAQTYLGGVLSLQGLTLAGLYLLGIVAAVVVALVLKRTILRGQPPPFLLELPSYKWPSPRTVLLRMAERGWVFVRCAGSLILAISIMVWAALYYPPIRMSSNRFGNSNNNSRLSATASRRTIRGGKSWMNKLPNSSATSSAPRNSTACLGNWAM